ncbi:pleckstrin homology domain-containing family J member 1-like isoform X1 [Panulirus ornatus]|uniref:pleckstrin homology domain-containing family J member 1-like isoform X1 n=1 Tax=Panulirus ornatus TaxID=150431 RepID=UPI003A89AB44
MRFNTDDLAEYAVQAGDHEGRLTHKPPPRTLYDTACKERWFKLKSNFLFYYRLNEFGGVDKNEPNGVFVLENIEVLKEEAADAPFAFAIKWKDDPYRKHLFFAQSEPSVHVWINKIINASYEHKRAQLIMLRVQIRRKTGKDPLEHFGTPLPQRASWSMISQETQCHMALEGLCVSRPSFTYSSSVPSSPSTSHTSLKTPGSPSGLSLPSKSPNLRVRIPKSPSLRQPTRSAPVPPPRRGKKQSSGNGHVVVEDLVPGVGCITASFKSHLTDGCTQNEETSLLD